MNIGQNTSRKHIFSDKNAQNTIFHNSHKNKKKCTIHFLLVIKIYLIYKPYCYKNHKVIISNRYDI